MIVLGIDPGLANTGYGVVAREGARMVALDGGTVETEPGIATELRLAEVATRLGEVLDEHACEAVALERLYFGQNVRSAFEVGHARGVAMALAGERRLPCFSYTPQQVKAAVCGVGKATKQQVAKMVAAQLSLAQAPLSDHASDALAVAICHLNATPMSRALLAAGASR